MSPQSVGWQEENQHSGEFIVLFDIISRGIFFWRSYCLIFFQVSTKEVIKFQMVGAVFLFAFIFDSLKQLTNMETSFIQAYSNLLRAHMDGLKKKDKKSKSKKTKATQWSRDSFKNCTVQSEGMGEGAVCLCTRHSPHHIHSTSTRWL